MSTNKKCFFTYKYYYAYVFKMVDMDISEIADFLKHYYNCAFYISPLHPAKDDRSAHYHILFATDNRNLRNELGKCDRITDPNKFIDWCNQDNTFDFTSYFYLV